MYKCYFYFLLICINSVKSFFHPDDCGDIALEFRNYKGEKNSIEKWPWQIHLKVTEYNVDTFENNYHVDCGAVFLDRFWLLTTASCLSKFVKPKIFVLRNENFTLTQYYKKYNYDRIFFHPEYREISREKRYFYNDLAVIKITCTNKFERPYVRPCLPKPNIDLERKSSCFFSGFGSSERYDYRQVKQIKVGKVNIIDNRACISKLSFPYFDDSTMMCGITKQDIRTCKGDFGGPLVCRGSFDDSKPPKWYLFGLISYNDIDCTRYTVYTKVSSYIEWIYDTIRRN